MMTKKVNNFPDYKTRLNELNAIKAIVNTSEQKITLDNFIARERSIAASQHGITMTRLLDNALRAQLSTNNDVPPLTITFDK